VTNDKDEEINHARTFFEEFSVGQKVVTVGRTMSEGDIFNFAGLQVTSIRYYECGIRQQDSIWVNASHMDFWDSPLPQA